METTTIRFKTNDTKAFKYNDTLIFSSELAIQRIQLSTELYKLDTAIVVLNWVADPYTWRMLNRRKENQ